MGEVEGAEAKEDTPTSSEEGVHMGHTMAGEEGEVEEDLSTIGPVEEARQGEAGVEQRMEGQLDYTVFAAAEAQSQGGAGSGGGPQKGAGDRGRGWWV